MAKPVEGVYENIIKCAKDEFLKKGYTDASLRTIAVNAETTTGSIYSRFKDKEGLFNSIVEPVLQQLLVGFRYELESFDSLEKEAQINKMPENSMKSNLKLLDYVYEYFDIFRLLLDSSYGTKYSNFIDTMVRTEVEYTYHYMDTIGCSSLKETLITKEFMHIISSSYFEGFFEVVRHNMKKEDAIKHIEMLRIYHMAGFNAIFQL